LDGNISGTALVAMPVSELATKEAQARAQRIADAKFESGRSDYYDINRDKILLANGLDPSAGGEFTCKKCKGTKTSSFAAQTRSCDEPMTVFVRCLTCGNRWKC
jgi:transcription elongation factor S-II